jgi:two-component system sensor histidine kinase BaeS
VAGGSVQLPIVQYPADDVQISGVVGGGQVAETHRAAAEQAGLELRRPAGADIVLVLEPVRLLVGNLVATAIRHTPPGGEVTISSARAPSSPSRSRLSASNRL